MYLSNNDALLINFLKNNGLKNVPKKGIDIVLNINKNLSFGEVKEINESGGSQNLQFNNLKEIANYENGFGIIYGNILFSDNKIRRTVENNPNIFKIWEFDELISSI